METLAVPEGGTPPVIESRSEFKNALDALRGGAGPIAIDAERASGYRYSARAYLIQIFRRGGGLHLLDPIALSSAPEIDHLNEIIAIEESVIHASSQDLDCLRDFGLNPKILFDTELGARIAGCERVGLGALCESLLGIQIAKEHSAVDWSHRPLKQEWLDYAALDVAVLLDIRDRVENLLIESGKLDWAKEEFVNSLNIAPVKLKRDPWRRTSGMHQIKSRFELALIRELWIERDKVARELDIAPGRLLSDLVIIDLARKKPESYEELLELPIVREKIRHEDQRSQLKNWWRVLSGAYEMDQSHWPDMRARSEGIPPPKIWRDKFPIAYAHYQHARASLSAIGEELKIPLENLIAPDLVRRITFDEGRERVLSDEIESMQLVETALREGNARPWQINLALTPLIKAFAEREGPSQPEQPPLEE
ncbi:MAG: ribonuclease D [Actinobacteria bacterium]|nr:ribonuclease D [Actinomycetota bacterium]